MRRTIPPSPPKTDTRRTARLRPRPDEPPWLTKLFKTLVTRPPAQTFRSFLSHFLLTTPLIYGDRTRLHLAKSAVVNNALFNLASGDIWVADHVVFGHNVSLLTGTHDYTLRGAARANAVPSSGRDISIETGAWIASNVSILGGCRVGAHAVVAAGSVVTSDVPPLTLVGGIPARILRPLRDT